MKYSATTVFLPHLTLEEQAELLARLGFDGIELRVRRVSPEDRARKKPSNWGWHVNDITPENFEAKAPEIRSVLDRAGIALAGIASNAPCTDLEQIKRLVAGAVAAGAPFIRVGAAAGFRADGSTDYRAVYGETLAGYARALEISRGSGVRIVLEIHGGTIHPSASLAYRIVSQFPPADVGVIYDPQNMVRDGFETTALALQLLGPYLAHCHVGGHRPVPGGKDAAGTTEWKWEGCSLADGLYDYRRLMDQLRRMNYSHFISIEDFRAFPSPEERLEEGIRYLRKLEASPATS